MDVGLFVVVVVGGSGTKPFQVSPGVFHFSPVFHRSGSGMDVSGSESGSVFRVKFVFPAALFFAAAGQDRTRLDFLAAGCWGILRSGVLAD
jgi:hypothetical protein